MWESISGGQYPGAMQAECLVGSQSVSLASKSLRWIYESIEST